MHNEVRIFMKAVGPIEEPKIEGDVGYDLPSSEDIVIPWQGFAQVHTGVHVEMPHGTWGMIVAKSSCNFTKSLINLTGVIDNGYRGELTCLIHNVAHRPWQWYPWRLWEMFTGQPIPERRRGLHVRAGQSLGQLVLVNSVVAMVVRVEELSESVRGRNGYGSTGNGVKNSHVVQAR